MIAVQTPGSAGLPVNQPLGQGNESGVNASGGVGVIKISGLSSDVTTVAKNLATMFNGDIEILNAILETDAIGFVGGTNVQILKDDPIGEANILVETVANLGANATVDLNSASVTKQRCIIRQGYHLQINSTVAVCTGAGQWLLYVEFRPLIPSATMA